MPRRFVTYAQKPKRSPRKKKAMPLASAAIVTTASRKQMKLERASRRGKDRPEDPEASAAMRAWLERAKWGRGPWG